MLGTVQPIAEVGRIAREHDLLFLVDAAQTAGVFAIDIQEMNIDLLAAPGTNRCWDQPAPASSTSGPGRAWRRGARAAPAAIPPARRSRASSPISSKVVLPMFLALLDSSKAFGCPTAGLEKFIDTK